MASSRLMSCKVPRKISGWISRVNLYELFVVGIHLDIEIDNWQNGDMKTIIPQVDRFDYIF